jgi:hypothetical protein
MKAKQAKQCQGIVDNHQNVKKDPHRKEPTFSYSIGYKLGSGSSLNSKI